MEIVKTPIAGVVVIKPKVFGDARGYFVETWHEERYVKAGLNCRFVQDNHSTSRRNVVRGLHYQKAFAQGKLVSVSLGNVFDVAVDIRPGSPTFGKWYGCELSADNQHQLWIAPGLAHGFAVLSELAHFHYKCTEYYHPEVEACLRWDDPELGIVWPVEKPILSENDKNGMSFAEYRAAHER